MAAGNVQMLSVSRVTGIHHRHALFSATALTAVKSGIKFASLSIIFFPAGRKQYITALISQYQALLKACN
jgi:hypothetical protein